MLTYFNMNTTQNNIKVLVALKYLTYHEIIKMSEDDCMLLLYNILFKDPKCSKCGRVGQFHRHRSKRCFTCNCGQVQIYPQSKTFMSNSSIKLKIWFLAVNKLFRDPYTPAKEIERQFYLTYPTAWRLKNTIMREIKKLP